MSTISLANKNYTVVSDLELVDRIIQVPEAIGEEIADLYERCEKGKPSAKEKVLKLVKRYPNAPAIKQLLVTWHMANNQDSAADRVNEELFRAFPEYVFAHVHKVARLLDLGNLEAAGNILGENFDIGYHFPNRKVFDEAEYGGFVGNVVSYLTFTGRFEEAEAQIELLRQVGDEAVDALSAIVTRSKLKKNAEAFWSKADLREAIQVEEYTLPQREAGVIPALMEFAFLYNKQWEIDTVLLKHAMVHQKDALVSELRHIIQSAIAGAEYCDENNTWTAAVLHASLIMPYVDDEGTFADALLLYRQPEKCPDYWLLDWREDLIHPYFKKFSSTKLQLVKEFLLESPGNTNSKITITSMLPQFVVYTPDSRTAVVACLKEMMEYFLAHDDDEGLIDAEVIGFLITAAEEIQAKELMDVIGKLYGKGWVSEMIEGSLEDCKKIMNDDLKPFEYKVYENVFEHLAILKTEMADEDEDGFGNASSIDDDDDGFEDAEVIEDDEIADEAVWDLFEADKADKTKQDIAGLLEKLKKRNEVVVRDLTPPVNKNFFAHASKNAPCPCGSGKKYKRCHGM